MITRNDTPAFPDAVSVAPELVLGDAWDAEAVSDLIRSKSDFGETPAFLFLGKKEASLLRDHLAEVFGSDAVATLHDTYYMGLEVVEIGCDSFLFAGGRKVVRTLQDPISRRPAWRDRDTDTLWQFRV
jgi:hypothetical protein